MTSFVNAPQPVAAAPAPPAPVPAKPVTDLDNVTENAATTPPSNNLIEIRSPIVGTFYRSTSPDKPPLIKPGDSIVVGTVVCIVEAMKLFNEIESEVAGKVVKILVEDASPVEYDQLLFLIDPTG
jgi:acetyl-CoA carboxylase biotin carboxyl carrier protein